MTTPPVTPPPDESPGKIAPAKSLESDQAIRQPPAGTSFESHMQRGTTATQGPNAPNPMELNRAGTAPGTPTMNTLIDQSKVAQDALGTVHEQLNTPNLKLKRSQAHLLKNKLTDARDYSRAAAAKLGVETPMEQPSGGSGALDRFLLYAGDGQNQLLAVQKKLEEMSATGQQLNAADMLIIQSKMGLAQQEIEYSSTLLSKVMSSVTTIMNIQL